MPAAEVSPEVALFDLDGTLSDSAPGILAALRHAFVAHGLPQLDPARERSLLGPPFYESLPPLIGAARVADVIASYRRHYAAGSMFDAVAYAGVPEVLAAAHAAGLRLAVATSKPEHFALPIVERLGLDRHFETIGGDDLDGSLPTKALVIDKVLRRLGNPPASSVIMIGDRQHDVAGARAHGIHCLGAAWGYGAPDELRRAGAVAVLDQPIDLLEALGLTPAGDSDRPVSASSRSDRRDAAAS